MTEIEVFRRGTSGDMFIITGSDTWDHLFITSEGPNCRVMIALTENEAEVFYRALCKWAEGR